MCRKSILIGFVALAIVGLCLAPIAHATIICAHSGQTDPTTEGFTVDAAGTGTPTIGPGNDGEDYWGIAVTDGRYNYNYGLTAAQLADPGGWHASARVKALKAVANMDQAFFVRDYIDTYAMLLHGGPGVANPGVYMCDSNWQLGNLISSIDPTLAYHTYAIWYDPSITGVRYFVDGVEKATQTSAEAPHAWDQRKFVWGDNATDGDSSGHWAMARFETGQIPEPSTLVLFATGLVGLLAYAWRKRK